MEVDFDVHCLGRLIDPESWSLWEFGPLVILLICDCLVDDFERLDELVVSLLVFGKESARGVEDVAMHSAGGLYSGGVVEDCEADFRRAHEGTVAEHSCDDRCSELAE